MVRRDVLIALGGNAITVPGEEGNLQQQFAHTHSTMDEIASLVEDGVLDRFILTHGNGPQVGNVLLRSELASGVVYPLTLDVCVSDTQGGMGYMIQQVLQNCLMRRGLPSEVATVVTRVLVDREDEAFKNPTKYVGPWMTEEDAKAKAKERGWQVREDRGRGWRRVVPSPLPRQILEIEAIKRLYEAGMNVIAAGGGGIPVAPLAGGGFSGVEGVIDKDLASALLANELGFHTLLIITGCDGIYTDFHEPNQKHYPVLTASQLETMAAQGHFPAGSMGPKVRAALNFLRGGGKRVLITELGKIRASLQGVGGSAVYPDAVANGDEDLESRQEAI
ncbi:MAG: carbamate kinase [Sumerlaeia bacterium]